MKRLAAREDDPQHIVCFFQTTILRDFSSSQKILETSTNDASLELSNLFNRGTEFGLVSPTFPTIFRKQRPRRRSEEAAATPRQIFLFFFHVRAETNTSISVDVYATWWKPGFHHLVCPLCNATTTDILSLSVFETGSTTGPLNATTEEATITFRVGISLICSVNAKSRFFSARCLQVQKTRETFPHPGSTRSRSVTG